ncbi:lasso peptide biosynthesis PqqD family chaperone [Metabacillus litoralis]|uniref:lasso peptide biosynthesis PqqD family chaperone n=1 Tax=Metabacillus litoralis TaxID=152268 RepID=UPI001CFF1BA1|nr:lasso peptide biosynthesis PqqD family chaperone [Metabacillus litoralis]
MESIEQKSLIKRKSNILASDMDGETVMMNIETGKYYNIGNIGGAIWSLIEKPTQVDTLIVRLTEEYEVERSQCKADILPFLNKIFQQQLIEIVK